MHSDIVVIVIYASGILQKFYLKTRTQSSYRKSGVSISSAVVRLHSSREVLLSKLVDERCRIQFMVALIGLVVHDFLQNSRKYELGSVRKKGTPS